MEETKVCTMCGREQPLDKFYKHPKTISGYQSQCKVCIRVSNKTRRRARKRYVKLVVA